jgi:hypothetical protein
MTLTRLTHVIQDEPVPSEAPADLLAHAAGDAVSQERESDQDAAGGADFADLGLTIAPAKKPKLKINTKYARPARPAQADSSAEGSAERQRGAADGS